MASVSSLDKDLRQLRLDKYTPQAANEVRNWIEEVLGEKLAPGDLLEALKDGGALCRLVNHAVSPGVKYKQSAMPFVQMENISHFLRACQTPPLSLPPHDLFLTVDLYEAKDPAQVLQCIGAFSRRANAINPSAFPRTIGGKSRAGMMSPQFSGPGQGTKAMSGLEARARDRAGTGDTTFPAGQPAAKLPYSGRVSPTKGLGTGGLASPGPVSSWSKKDDEGVTAPAWNIHQYGYMGGASQGNQGVSFGARRQITSAAPAVPSLAEKERVRQEEQARVEQERRQNEEIEAKRRAGREADEERARRDEERNWEEETSRLREKERREAEEEKRRWDEEQRQWKEEEEMRVKEEREQEARLAADRKRTRTLSDARLNGQFLSQYQAKQQRPEKATLDSASSPAEGQRIKELERQLAEAKERERQYESARQAKMRNDRVPQGHVDGRQLSQQAAYNPPSIIRADEGDDVERDFLRQEWQSHQDIEQPPPKPPRPQPVDPVQRDTGMPPILPSRSSPAPMIQEEQPPAKPPRPQTASTMATASGSDRSTIAPSSIPSRALPQPTTQSSSSSPTPYNRADRYLATNPAPVSPSPTSHRPADYSTTTEVDVENTRRLASQQRTKAGGWASKSLLEREMERERERQREWEESQKATAAASRDPRQGSNPGQSWDVNQYGYTGGDNQNRGGPGLGVGGARRQIIGPRPPP